MLPRIAEWYDVVLGCIKLGAVPTAGRHPATARDIAYRLEKAGAAVAITDPEGTGKVDEAATHLGMDLTRICVDGSAGSATVTGALAPGWASWTGGLEAASEAPPDAEPTHSDDPVLVYFTSGTVAYATIGYPRGCTMPLTWANARRAVAPVDAP